MGEKQTTGAVKILAVDDVPVNLALLEAYLEDYTIQLKTLGTAINIVEEVEKFKPDLILMDIRMPVVDGMEATRRVKQNEGTSHIPIVAFTASLINLTSTDLFAGILGKPVSRKQLMEILEKHLDVNRWNKTTHTS